MVAMTTVAFGIGAGGSVLVDVIQKSYSRHIPRQLLHLQHAGKNLIALSRESAS
jgi:hypothetical protein